MNRIVRVDPLPLRVELDGKRWYRIPELGLVPSVTTVLEATRGKQWALDNWRANLGHETADLVRDVAAQRGRELHAKVERFLLEGVRPEGEADDTWWQCVCPFVENLARIGDVVLCEGAVWHPLDRYAGTLDDLMRILRSLHLFDWKTCTTEPTRERMDEAADQCAAYADAFAQNEGERPSEASVVWSMPDRPGRPIVQRVDLDVALGRWRARRRAFGWTEAA